MVKHVWEPTGYYRTESNIATFLEEYGYDDHDELIPQSETSLENIWGDMVEDSGIEWSTKYDEVVDTTDGVEFACWFTNGELNATKTILDKWESRSPRRAMYVWVSEDGETETVTYAEMRHQVDELANALRNHSIGKGDVVGITFPMHPKGFVAALACLRIGAIFTQVFPGYGPEAMGRRFNDAGAELVITVDGYKRNGSVNDLASKVGNAIVHAPAVSDVVVYNHETEVPDIEGATVHKWSSFVDKSSGHIEIEAMDSDDTAFIAYSSGTTGTPKGTIHTHASLLAMGNKEARYHFDASEGDTFMWVTDYGWIIVPIWMMAGAPALGATTVLMEGGPFAPSHDRIWRTIEEYEVNIFGIAPTGARTLRKADSRPRDHHDLSSLRILGSTGEPWNEETWLWFLEHVGGEKAPIINASGGTELAGAILSPTPLTPLRPGTLYGPAPGIAANIFNENGDPSQQGYLVVEQPFPGMTHGLTDGDERYLDEYWRTFPGVWNQNDWAERDEDGFWYITGRADDTMNIAGRRVTAPAIEEVITGHPTIDGAAVVAIPHEKRGQVPVAFITVSDAESVEDGFSNDIRKRVADELGPMFRPVAVHTVSHLPRTQTGKLPREIIRDAYLDRPLGNVSTLEDGETLQSFPKRTRDDI